MDKDIFNIKNDGIKNGDLDGRYKNSWIEENMVLGGRNDSASRSSQSRSYLGTGIGNKKFYIFLFVVILGISIIFTRVIYLQIIRGDYYRSLAENNRIRIKPVKAERGLIYDREGRQIVENLPSFSLSIVPQNLPQNYIDRLKIIDQIAQISGVPEQEIENLVKKYSAYSYESLTIKDNLDYESALKLYVQNADLPGILIEKGTRRHYLLTSPSGGDVLSLSHVAGYLGKINDEELNDLKDDGYLPSDYLGKVGIEDYYETELRGIYGRKKIEVDALGREQSVLAEEPPTPGDNIFLSIDLQAQEIMENLIESYLQKSKKTRAAGIAMNPETGEILALVSLPAFNSNDFASGISAATYTLYSENLDRPLFNRSIAGTYPSGSTVKMLIAAAALQEKIITRNTTVLSNGGIEIDKWFFKDWKAGGHGITNVTKAIAWSVNTFFYYIGGGYKNFDGLGINRIIEYLKKFNLSQKTGIDLPGESSGFLPSKEWKESTKNEIWYIGDTYNLSIGQGDLLVTPLQVAGWTASVANGGKVVKPRLAAEIYDPVQKKSELIPVDIINKNFIDRDNMETVKQGMRECVTYGSCQMLKSLNFSSGGKTGTAQWSKTHKEHAWFTSFAPYNKPQIVVTVLIEEGGEGSAASMPIATEFLRWWGAKYLTSNQ